MPRLIDSDRQAAIRDVMNSRRVITVSDAEMIGALLGVPGSVILSDVQAIKESATRGLLVVLSSRSPGSRGRSGPDSIY